MNFSKSKRTFLTTAVASIVSIGAALVSTPFLRSWNPRKGRIFDYDIKVKLSDIPLDDPFETRWMGKSVLIFRLSDVEAEKLNAIPKDAFVDPESMSISSDNTTSKIKIVVVEPTCTHLGCKLLFARKDKMPGFPKWEGGFVCPCHSSVYDLAGRVYKGVPAKKNLQIPPYTYLDEDTLLIGAGAVERS